MREIPRPSGALAQMLRATGELDRILDGRGLDFSKPEPDPPPVTPGPGLYIEPPDWAEEERERRERERQARDAELDAELSRRQEAGLLEEEPRHHPPPARTAS